MTTIDTALDASINANELAGAPSAASHLAEVASLSPAITADYYNLTESDGWPIAGLVVLLDRHHRPVRAEVHLYDNTMGRRQDDALNNANNLLIQKYRSLTDEDSKLPLRVMRTRQELDTLSVQLDVDPAPAPVKSDTFVKPAWFSPATGIAALTVVVIATLLVTIAVLIQRNSSDIGNVSASAPGLEMAAVGQGGALPYYGDELLLAGIMDPPQQAAVVTESQAITESAAEPAALPVQPVEHTVIADYINPYPPQTNDLPASTVAYPFALQDGAQVAVGHLAVQSQPDPDPTHSIAWKEQGSVVQLIGGPVWKSGDSDTIVWWYVRTDDDKEGWMAANGSTVQFLAPLP